MTAKGKHEAGKGSGSAESTGKIPRHGGPQTGTGFTAQGRKPKPSETTTQGKVPKKKGK